MKHRFIFEHLWPCQTGRYYILTRLAHIRLRRNSFIGRFRFIWSIIQSFHFYINAIRKGIEERMWMDEKDVTVCDFEERHRKNPILAIISSAHESVHLILVDSSTLICLDKYERSVRKDHKTRAGIEPTSSDNRTAILPLNYPIFTSVAREALHVWLLFRNAVWLGQ